MKFGAHISSAAPFSEAVNRAKKIGCECMQVFLNQPQRWSPLVIPEGEIERFIELNKGTVPSGGQSLEVSPKIIDPIISHTIYLISFSGNNSFYYEASKKSIIDEMEKGKKMGFFGVNTHLGSSKDKTFDEVFDNVVSAISAVLAAVPEGPYFIIENSAGAGNIIGDTFEEIGRIVTACRSERVKVILDTAHLFESGYPINTAAGLEETIEKFDKTVGLPRLVGFHLNDSATPFNSKKDRHADIGEGYIGKEAFARIIHHPRLKDLFGIIETPTSKSLRILREL
ncbi:MAG: deoxyribonuclease IV [Patescibacteria group bacterium]